MDVVTLVIVVPIIYLMILVIRIVISHKKQAKAPIISNQAKLLSKDTEWHKTMKDSEMFKHEHQDFYLEFELHNKKISD